METFDKFFNAVVKDCVKELNSRGICYCFSMEQVISIEEKVEFPLNFIHREDYYCLIRA